jgi:hypothetical protein
VRKPECSREFEVLDALQTAAWPECCSDTLRTHVAECQSCAAVVEIVLALTDEHRTATLEASVPSSGIVWWRAQMRARQEATVVAMRPIHVVQGLSLACGAGLLAAAVSFVSPTFRSWLAWIGGAASEMKSLELPAAIWSNLQGVVTPSGSGPVLLAAILAITALILLAPVAVYFSARD